MKKFSLIRGNGCRPQLPNSIYGPRIIASSYGGNICCENIQLYTSMRTFLANWFKWDYCAHTHLYKKNINSILLNFYVIIYWNTELIFPFIALYLVCSQQIICFCVYLNQLFYLTLFSCFSFRLLLYHRQHYTRIGVLNHINRVKSK